MPDKLLSVSNLSKYFDAVASMVNVTFDVEPGQVLGVVGQRGSGKSTLFKLLSGFYTPSSGEIYFNGKRITHKPIWHKQRLGIETVLQDPQLLVTDNLDVLNNVFLGRQLTRLGLWTLRKKEMMKTVQSLLAAFDMPPDLIEERASNLPDEQRRIVALARALCRPCRLLLLDDTMVPLSFERQQKLLAYIKALAAQNVAVIFSSDNLKNIFNVADHILVLYQGRLAAIRPTAETTHREIVELIADPHLSSSQQDQVTPMAWAFESYRAAEEQAEELRRAQLELTQANTALTRRAMQLEISAKVAQQATSILDQDELSRQVVDLIQAHFGYYFVGIWLLSESQDEFVLRAGSGQAGEGLIQQQLHIPIKARSIIANVYKTAAPRLENDVLQALDYLKVEGLPGTRSELTLPFRIGQTVIGVLDIESDLPQAFDSDDLLVMQTLADQIAIAIRNAQLYQVQVEVSKELRRADQMKSQFLSSMSHELRTPLNAMINFVEMVAMELVGPISGEQKELLELSLQSSKHLLQLINDVLDLSKIQAGMLTLLVEPDVDLYRELQTVIEMVTPMLKKKSVQLLQEIEDDLPIIAGDKRRIRQILLNLLSNAIKFTERGAITVKARRDRDFVLFGVLDTGPGIAPEAQSAIFEPFVQTLDGVKMEQGTGLGLPITLNLVQAHGGQMWLESEVGKGSAFYFTLPLAGKSWVQKKTKEVR